MNNFVFTEKLRDKNESRVHRKVIIKVLVVFIGQQARDSSFRELFYNLF